MMVTGVIDSLLQYFSSGKWGVFLSNTVFHILYTGSDFSGSYTYKYF